MVKGRGSGLDGEPVARRGVTLGMQRRHGGLVGRVRTRVNAGQAKTTRWGNNKG